MKSVLVAKTSKERGGEGMDADGLSRSQAFARYLLEQATDEGLTVGELRFALDYAKEYLTEEVNQAQLLHLFRP